MLKAEGIEVPAGVRVRAVENTAQAFTFVIPARPTDLEDEQLSGLAGGGASDYCVPCEVVVPGLRHFWARFGPGRLYEVPVAMGWLERPLTEDQLNPIPFFY